MTNQPFTTKLFSGKKHLEVVYNNDSANYHFRLQQLAFPVLHCSSLSEQSKGLILSIYMYFDKKMIHLIMYMQDTEILISVFFCLVCRIRGKSGLSCFHITGFVNKEQE